MKRIFIALAIIASLQVANAQVKSPAAAKKAVESAELAAQNEKKATKLGTWTKLGQTYVDAYNAPAGQAWVGASKQELALVMEGAKPLSSEQVEVGGQPFIKEVYEDKDFYFNAAGVLAMIDVTKPVYADALEKAVAAYKKAAELDVKGSKASDISKALESITNKYRELAFTHYTFGRYAQASEAFAKAAETSATAPYSTEDFECWYNAGYTAEAAGDDAKALSCFEKCYAGKYYNEGGEVFSKLGEVYSKLGKKNETKKILEEGFEKFPQSQSILIGLINYYIESKDDPAKLFSLLEGAKKNEPNNASLYYVEGNVHKQLADALLKQEGKEAEAEAEKDAAIAAYMKCAEINPEYEFGYIGAGVLYYENALVYQELASNEYDDKKYMALVEKFEEALGSAMEPFEKAFAICKDESIKVSLAEYLKNIYYRFSSKDAKYEELYKKYNEYSKQ